MTVHAIRPAAPSLAEQLAQAIADYDAAEFEQMKRKALIDELGRLYIAEKYPNSREPMKPTWERLRRELSA